LDLHWPKLDSPSDVVVWWWRFEAHVLPIGRLEILKMVRLGQIKAFEIFAEDHKRISNEEMRKVGCKKVVHASLYQSFSQLFVHYQIWIKILRP
jgi:hypothetical protein